MFRMTPAVDSYLLIPAHVIENKLDFHRFICVVNNLLIHSLKSLISGFCTGRTDDDADKMNTG